VINPGLKNKDLPDPQITFAEAQD
ncbi:uncharacterized protein METZ01_LOCUS24997, partial [marine metagenome]